MPIREIKVKELRGARFGVAAAATTTTTKAPSGFKGALIVRQPAQQAGAVAGCGLKSGSSSFQSANGQQLREEEQKVARAASVARGQSDLSYLMNHSELCSSAVCPTNVIMQPIRRRKIQSINDGAQKVHDNGDDDENNPNRRERSNPLEKERTGKESELAAGGCRPGRCDHSSPRRRAPKLAPSSPLSTLISSYCFLLACASVVCCAPAGSPSHNQHASAVHFERRLAPTPEAVALALQLTGAQMEPAGGGDLSGMVRPIAVLNVYENDNNHRHHHHPKFSSEQRKQRDEVNISMKPSASSLVRQPDTEFEDAADEDDDERQMLLVLASDNSESPSSLRRLIKRSGISDQRLAEIQMIRALKKQLERAATKIAADSTGGGGGGDGGPETAAKTAA